MDWTGCRQTLVIIPHEANGLSKNTVPDPRLQPSRGCHIPSSRAGSVAQDQAQVVGRRLEAESELTRRIVPNDASATASTLLAPVHKTPSRRGRGGMKHQARTGGAGGARTHDRRIMRTTARRSRCSTCTVTTEPCHRWPSLHCMHGWLGPRTGPRPPQGAPDVNYGASRHAARDPPFWTVRAAAMSCIGARMGCWQAVGEIQIGALVPEGYGDSGSLINALTRVARWARERRKMLRPRPCCVTSPGSCCVVRSAAQCGSGGSPGAGFPGRVSSVR
jgi:hypothetical protein